MFWPGDKHLGRLDRQPEFTGPPPGERTEKHPREAVRSISGQVLALDCSMVILQRLDCQGIFGIEPVQSKSGKISEIHSKVKEIKVFRPGDKHVGRLGRQP